MNSAMSGQMATLSLSLRDSSVARCSPCAARLCDALRDQAGVEDVQVSPDLRTLTVAFDPSRVSVETLTDTTRQTQSELATTFAHQTFSVAGMDCPNCATGLERAIQALPGVVSAAVEFTAARMRVEYDAADAQALPRLLSRARSMGYRLTDVQADAPQTTGTDKLAALPIWEAGLSSAFLVIGLILEHTVSVPEIVVKLLYGLSLMAGGGRFAAAGLAALRTGVFGTQLLMALAAVGALILGHWEEAAMVVALYAVGLALEKAALDRSRASLRNLITAAPTEALLLDAGGNTQTVPAASLQAENRILVRPGGKVPSDGVIVAGRSSLMEAALTGESLPRDKSVGDTVYAGTINGDGALTVAVTAVGEDTTLARLLHLVEEAQAQKAPLQAFVERFGRIYTPVVLVAAVLVGLLGTWFWPGENPLYRALTLLVVSCPCALIIATPVAYVSAIAGGARRGILVKGGTYLETLAQVQRIFFDKTGTLTTGALRVAGIFCRTGTTEQELLQLAAAAEQQSDHPFAQAVRERARESGISLLTVTESRAVPGRGVIALINGQQVLAGNRDFMTEQGLLVPSNLEQQAIEATRAGQGLLFVATRTGDDSTVHGLVTLADTLRPEAASTLSALADAGIPFSLLTGDHSGAAAQIAQATGMSTVHAGLLPQDKQAIVQDAVRNHQIVAFVGDGINDAPALTTATVGIAIGPGGSAAALEAADIVLMRGDLQQLLTAFRQARRTQGVVRANVAIAFGTVLLLLGTTLFGHLPLPVGVLGHEGSALLVILNSLRLLHLPSNGEDQVAQS